MHYGIRGVGVVERVAEMGMGGTYTASIYHSLYGAPWQGWQGR